MDLPDLPTSSRFQESPDADEDRHTLTKDDKALSAEMAVGTGLGYGPQQRNEQEQVPDVWPGPPCGHGDLPISGSRG